MGRLKLTTLLGVYGGGGLVCSILRDSSKDVLECVGFVGQKCVLSYVGVYICLECDL
jgi:hypothetical protein